MPAQHMHHPPPESEHHRGAAAHIGPHALSKKALRKEISEIREKLKGMFEDSDTLLKGAALHAAGASVYGEIDEIKKEAHRIKKAANTRWMKENKTKYEEMETYIATRKANPASTMPNPHPGIHGEHVLYLHEETIEIEDGLLKNIHDKMANMVKHHGLPPSSGPELTNELPTPTTDSPTTYYIYSIIRYMAREKYRYVCVVDNIIRKLEHGKRSEAQNRYKHLFDEITVAKTRQSEAREQLGAMYKKKPHKPRAAIPALPDNGNPPRQVRVPRDVDHAG